MNITLGIILTSSCFIGGISCRWQKRLFLLGFSNTLKILISGKQDYRK